MNSAETHALALRLYEAGRFEEALALLRQALADGESSELWSDWATVQFRRGEAGEAVAGYRIALEMNPNETQAAANLGAILLAQGRATEALPFLERGLAVMTPEQRAAMQIKIIAARHALQLRSFGGQRNFEEFLRLYVSDDTNERSYFETHIRRYVATLEALPAGQPGQRLLELGAAFHHLTAALIHCKGYEEVRCTDVWEGEPSSKRVLASNDGKLRDEVTVDNFDLQSSAWPYADGGFDVVLCCEILEHLALDPMAQMAEMNRVLRPGGTLLLTTPNLACAHAVEQTLRAESPYCYGQFEIGGRTTDRHNREYTAAEVAALVVDAGFETISLRTQDFYWPPKHETLLHLARLGFPLSLRGDSTFLLARKTHGVRERYPVHFYSTNGIQSARRERQDKEAPGTSAPTRPASQQNVLLIHEILPHYDCSGADLRIFELAREIRQEGHHVTFLARQDREREKYAPALEALGVHVIAGDPDRLKHLGEDTATPWDPREVLQEGKFHTAILCHWYWNAISIAEHYLDEIRRWSPQTCVMVLSEDRHGERERRCFPLSKHISDLERGEELEQREVEVYQAADLVLYTSEVDYRHYRKLLPDLRAEHLPTIAEAGKTGPGFRDREGVLFLGNFENLANRDGLRWLVREVWPRVLKEEPDLKLYVAGNALAPEHCPQGKNIVLLGKVAELGEAFASRRVFVGPVRYGTGIITKNMFSIAHGLPVVTTTVGGEGLQLVTEKHALIADSPEVFAASILRLHREESFWNTLSREGRDYIAGNFNQEKLRKQLRHILALAPALPRKAFDPSHQWSYRRVESAVPEVLSQRPARYRPQLRMLGYWQLGHALLVQGNHAASLEQYRHIFATLRDEIPATVFHIRLMEEMAECHTALRNVESAARCRAESERLAKIVETSFTRLSNAGKSTPRLAEKDPQISVIIPTYNRRETLQLALAALSFQTLPTSSYEVLVIDDGSSDGTEALCRTTAFPFGEIRYFRQQNGGAGSARRAGVEAARGKLLLFINDDTVSAPTLLAEHLGVHRRNPRERWAVLGSFIPTEECNRHALSLWLQRSTFLFPQNALHPGQLCDAAYFITCNLSVPRQAVIEAGSFDPTFRVGEDTELGIRLAAKGYRVKYHPVAQAWHEHPQVTTEDLLRRARTYGPVHVALFEKHPQLVQSGNTPFGKLTADDYVRMESEIKDKRAAVESALAGLRALDQLDLFELARKKLLDDAQLRELLGQVAQLVPIVYWTTLFESFLQAGVEHAHSAGVKAT
jgi:GT2 family glycosyltransferase/2-polyprenyl-3-methyl-5-hydroxy-6-metoxy-1,4-benzoquinol methylase/glycosyltransferase involved in cell wall biosynthesis